MRVVLLEFRIGYPYAVSLSNALAGFCDLTLMLPDRSATIQGVNKEAVNLQLFHMPRFRQWSNILMVRDVLRRIDHIRPDIVHCSFWHFWMMPAMALFLKYPLVSTVHDVSRHYKERGWWAIPSFLYRWQWQWADQIIVHATAAQQRLLTEYGCQPERVNVIPIGAYDYYRACASEIRQENPNTMLFFGRIWGYKGLQHLIEAEPLITAAVPNARIVIAGEGEPFEKYRQAMVHPEHFEVYNYHIRDEEVAPLFQQASVVVLPYIEASQSGIVSLAYAFGKPVVATRVGGIPDVVRHGQTGLLVPPDDVRSLADAIITLLKSQPLRHQMGECAREFAEKELSWDRIAQKTIKVYEKTLHAT